MPLEKMVDVQSLFVLFNQAHIMELEEEVKLLKNLKHPNIVVSIFLCR